MIKEKLVSCCPALLYRDGGFYDPSYSLDLLQSVPQSVSSAIQFEASLFESSESRRTKPICFSSPDETLLLGQYFKHVEYLFTVCAPSILVKIKNALIWNNMVFTVVGNDVHAIYESYRHPDRDQQGADLVARLPSGDARRTLPADGGNIFIGSAGSFNFGHWLVDDFAKLSAVPHIKSTKSKVRILFSGFNHVIDPVRKRGAGFFTNGEQDEIIVLDRDICYEVETLYYPTPISFHPVLKNRHALGFTRQFLLEAAEGQGKSFTGSPLLFVNRSDSWPRHITNAEELRVWLRSQDAFETNCDHIDLLEQVWMFHNAGSVIGIMGAAMTCQIFCKPDTNCSYLAPSGWHEPFYWDMCDQLKYRYKVYYGKSDSELTLAPYHRNFSVNIDDIIKIRNLE